MNLTDQEKEYIYNWENKELKKRNFKTSLIKGFRNSLILNSLIILSLTTGWYKRITLFSLSQFIFLLLSLFLIMLFITFFSAYYHTEQAEQYYLELKQKEKKQ